MLAVDEKWERHRNLIRKPDEGLRNLRLKESFMKEKKIASIIGSKQKKKMCLRISNLKVFLVERNSIETIYRV